MQISIKLKFLEALSDHKSLEILRVVTKADSQQNVHPSIKIQKSNGDEPLTSRRDISTAKMSQCSTPRQAITQRFSKSKQMKRKDQKKGYISSRDKKVLSKGEKSKSKHRQSVQFGEFAISKRKRKDSGTIFTGYFNGWDGKKILKQYSSYVNEYEKEEIVSEKAVYYIGKNMSKLAPKGDDADGNHLWQKHDHLGFRYELIEVLGKGSFGQVVKAFDHKTKDFVAIKIIRSNKQYFQLALNEIKVLTLIKENDLQGEKNCIRIKDFLVFRKHMVVFDQLSVCISLYDLLKLNNFEQMKMEFIRRFGIQIFSALAFMKELSIIHSDIKPENVLLKSRTKTGIKVIDFGTSIFDEDEHYSYVQSRYYRAPEVILGHPYSYPIDMWSTGCLLAELYLGLPIFGGSNEQQQLQLIMDVIGCPPIEYLQKCKRMEVFFYSDFTPKFQSQENINYLGRRSLRGFIKDPEFASFLQSILVWETDKRLTAVEALLHPWIIDHLPQQIREQHILSLKSKYHQAQMTRESRQAVTARKGSNSKPKRVKRVSQILGQKKYRNVNGNNQKYNGSNKGESRRQKQRSHFRRRSDF